jgi:signal transduction histidine kinase
MTGIAARPLRSTWLPVALVAIAMLYAALVPTLLRRGPDRLHSEIAAIVEPARRLARTRQTSLAVEVSAYRAYVISGDPQLLDRVREAHTRTEALGAQLASLTARLGPQTVEAAAAVDRRIREWHTGVIPRADVDLPSYRPTLPALQDRFEATEAATDRLDVVLSHEAAQRARKAESLTVYHDLGNVALSLLGAASVLAVTRLARREQRARAAAEAAVRSRDKVLSIVSHDLRTPLSTVSMAASYLLETPPSDEPWAAARRHLEMIKRGSDRMNHMIDDLLDVARIESDRLAIERAPVAVDSLMDEVASTLRPDVESHGQTLDCVVAPGLPTVYADHDRLLQVFSNLVGNAVKFAAPGGSITVAAAADQGAVRFSVSDTGSGIAPENVPHLFDRFWQATRTDRRGIGLGLSIVKALVEAHGGHVNVETRLGDGTTFSFSVPVAAALPSDEPGDHDPTALRDLQPDHRVPRRSFHEPPSA